MASLRHNILYKSLLSISNYLLALVTFPYITRVLGPEDFGTVNFALNTVDYFLLFASMGIVNIGTREIALCKNNSNNLNTTFSNILGLNIIFTAIVVFIYIAALFSISRFGDIRNLLLIGLLKIIMAAFAVEWFYAGLERFRYITLRSIAVKIIYVGSVFLFVKDTSDTELYFILTISAVVINNLINFIYSNHFISIRVKELFSLKYLKPNLKLGIYTIMTSMYVTFNVMYLGIVTDDLQVGYYTAGVKLYFVAVTLFASYTSVMMPRLTSLIGKNDMQSYNQYLKLSYKVVCALSIPIILIGCFYASEFIYILSGSGYTESIRPMQYIMPALLPVWMSSVLAFQGLMPMKKDGILVNASVVGGCLALLLNIIMVPRLGAVGSALTLLTCELSVVFVYVFYIKSKHLFRLPTIRQVLQLLVLALPYMAIISLSKSIFKGFVSLGISIIFCGVYFLIVNKDFLSVILGRRSKVTI